MDGTDAAVGGTGVAVAGTGVAVAGRGVAVGGTGVAVGGTGVAVGGTGVAVGTLAACCFATDVALLDALAFGAAVVVLAFGEAAGVTAVCTAAELAAPVAVGDPLGELLPPQAASVRTNKRVTSGAIRLMDAYSTPPAQAPR